MRPIVVGLDPERPLFPALEWAVGEARLRRRPLELRLARGNPLLSPAEVPVDVLMPDSVAERIIQQAVDHAKKAEPSVQVTGRVSNGGAGAVLVGLSPEAEAVVVGRQGRSRLTKTVLGSTSAQVAAHATSPVVVVDDRLQPRSHSPVVLGVDGSPANQGAIEYGYQAAQVRGVPLVAVYAWQLDLLENATLPWMSTESMNDLVEAQKRVLHEVLAGWSQRYPDVKVRRIVSRQRPVDRLTQEARSANLLVVGSRGRGGFAGLRLGSVSQGVLHRPHTCPVVVVHGHDRQFDRGE